MNDSVLSLTLGALAKINLTFEILGKRPDGYHELRSVVTTIPLCDTVTLSLETPKNASSGNLRIKANNAGLPTDDKNTCFKAVLAFDNELKKSGKPDILSRYSVDVHINKKIPVAGGLGGSSTDAAAVIMGINRLLGLEASREKLVEIANRVGSDLGSFVHGGITLQEGRGDMVFPISAEPLDLPLLLIVSNEKWETKDAYRLFDAQGKGGNKKAATAMLTALKEKNPEKVSSLLYNDLELSQNTDSNYIEKVKSDLKKFRALGTLMSGSGPTVYGVFSSNESLAEAEKELSAKYQVLAIPSRTLFKI